MADIAQDMLRDALDSFVRRDLTMAQAVLDRDDELDSLKTLVFREHDADKALAVWASDEEIDDTHTGIYRRLIAYMQGDVARVAIGAHLLFIAKNIERIGDHATNIAEAVYYLVTGEALAGPRPKGDKSSLDQVNPGAS
jgi:phosphate uptake regulator